MEWVQKLTTPKLGGEEQVETWMMDEGEAKPNSNASKLSNMSRTRASDTLEFWKLNRDLLTSHFFSRH